MVLVQGYIFFKKQTNRIENIIETDSDIYSHMT